MLPHDLTIAAIRRSAPLVRLVRIQSRQHAFRDGLEGIGRVAANTTLAACAAGLTSI